MSFDIDKQFAPIHGDTLSEAWACAFVKCWHKTGGILAPGIVHFNAYNSEKQIEIQGIRTLLEKQLRDFEIRTINISPVDTVASTIFPESVWKHCHGNRNKFYELYNKMWPKIKKCHANRNGVYFRRLTAFGEENSEFNQLEHILNVWHKGIHRHSALQAAIFDPNHDHRFARQVGFPCLQQIIFHPNGANGKDGLSVVALYANQVILEKAYGNYLGLHRLGCYMATEMGIPFRDVLCVASNLKISDKHGSKRKNKSLVKALEEELANV